MTNNELLLAISNMLDPIREEIQEIREEIREIKEDIREIRSDIQELKNRVKRIELIQENEIMPRLNTIESCYTSTYDRYKDSVEGYEALKADNEVMKKIIMEHSDRLKMLA